MDVATSTGPFGGLNGYWGQYGLEPLRNYCDTGIEYVTLGFVNVAPENDISGYPGTNFAGHCWAGVYSNKDDVPSRLLSECWDIKTDISYCQEQGVKVLLSIGGDYNPISSDYEVTSENNGADFAEFLYKAFGPYDPFWDGPRPFDVSETEHSVVDGFDFDIEAALDNLPYMSMIDTFRSHDPTIIITGAPQCPTSDAWFYMKEMIQEAAFDALFVQFYNNPVCDALSSGTGNKFNYDDWEDILDQSTRSKSAKLYVGLPASPAAAGSGFISPAAVKDLVCELKDKKHFGGISLWDLTRGASYTVDGKTYNEHVLDALKYGCDPIPTETPTPTPVSSTGAPTSSDVVTSTGSATETPITSDILTPTGTPTESPVSSGTLTPSGTPTESPISSGALSPSETPTETATSTDIPTPSETLSETSISSGLLTPTGTDISTPITSTAEDPASSTGSSGSSAFTNPNTIPSVTRSFSTTRGWNTTFTRSSTDSEVTSTTFDPSTTGPDGKPTGVSTGASTGDAELTTSTVYTTRVHTVTKCPPYVVNCPAGGYVTTETIPLYTTVCPVTKTAEAAVEATTAVPVGHWTTSTVYTTRVHTVTQCPPEVVDCPLRPHVTTETIPIHTTVVYVTKTAEGPVTTATVEKPENEDTGSNQPGKGGNGEESGNGDDEQPGKPGNDNNSDNDNENAGHSGNSNESGNGDESDESCTGEGCPQTESPTTIYTTIVLPPKTIETVVKPTASAGFPRPSTNGTIPAVPTTSGSTGACEGSGCPKAPAATTTSGNDSPAVTAGAASVAVGLTGLVAMVALQVLAL